MTSKERSPRLWEALKVGGKAWGQSPIYPRKSTRLGDGPHPLRLQKKSDPSLMDPHLLNGKNNNGLMGMVKYKQRHSMVPGI